MDRNIANEELVIDLKVIRACKLPQRLFSTLGVFVYVTPDNKQIFRTETVQGTDPVWNETFVFRVPFTSSSIKCGVFHSDDATNSTLIGETEVSVEDLLRADNEEAKYTLSKSGFKLHRHRGELIVSAKAHVDAAPSQGNTVGSGQWVHSAVSGSLPPPSSSAREFAVGNFHDIVTQPPLNSQPPVPPGSFHTLAGLQAAKDAMATVSGPKAMTGINRIVSQANNPMNAQIISSAGDHLTKILDNVVRLGDAFADVHVFAKVAWSAISGAYKVLKAQMDRDNKVRGLWATVQDVTTFLDEMKAEIKGRYLSRVISDVVKQVYECCQFLKIYGEHGFAGRTLHNTFSSTNEDTITRFTNSFVELKSKYDRGLSVDSWNGIRVIGSDISEIKDQVQAIWLHTLVEGNLNTPVECDTRRGCLPGTRVQLLDDILQWIHNPSGGRLLWLTGAVGTGKSSIANSIAGYLKAFSRLGASYRFQKQVDPTAVFRHIAYQLARVDPLVERKLLDILRQSGEIASAPLTEQAMRVIVEPLRAVDLVGPVVIVFDALDEITHRDPRIRDDILSFFSEDEYGLPDYIKIFITSRDESFIHARLDRAAGSDSLKIDDYEDTPEDIFVFVQTRLREIHQQFRRKLPEEWPPDGADRRIAESSERQFQWAFVTCQFIADRPWSRLSFVLENPLKHDGNRSLDVLYDSVLQSAHKDRDQDPTFVTQFGYVVGAVAAAKTPFNLSDLNDFLGLFDDRYTLVTLPGKEPFQMESVDQLISSVRSLFHMATRSQAGLHLVHTSLFEYLTDGKRCPMFYIRLPYWNLVLAIRCLRIMNSRLKADSKSESPTRLTVSAALQYSCQFFYQHVTEAEDRQDSMLTHEMSVFTSEVLLEWVKKMGFLGLEWRQILQDLMASYEIPPQYKLLITGNMDKKLGMFASTVGDSIGQLADLKDLKTAPVEPQKPGESDNPVISLPISNLSSAASFSTLADISARSRIAAEVVVSTALPPPAESSHTPTSSSTPEDGSSEEMGYALFDVEPIEVSRVSIVPSTAPTDDNNRTDDNDEQASDDDEKASNASLDFDIASCEHEDDDGDDDSQAPGSWSWGDRSILRPGDWFTQDTNAALSVQHEEYERVRQSIEDTVVDILQGVPARAKKPAMEQVLATVKAARFLLLIWATLENIKGLRQECLTVTGRCSEVLLTTYRETSKSLQPAYGKDSSFGMITDCLKDVATFFHALTHMSDTTFAANRAVVMQRLDQCNEDLSAILTFFAMSGSARLMSTREQLLGTRDVSELVDAMETQHSYSVVTADAVERGQQVGAGPSGSAFTASWKGYSVVMKTYTAGDTGVPMDAFLAMADVWSALRHPNVLALWGASGPQAPHPRFVITPFCAPGDLVAYLGARHGVAETEQLAAMLHIGLGMRFLHEQGLVHRNLQAANVLVADDGTFQVSGLTYLESPSTDTREPPKLQLPRETVAWRAPELLEDPDNVAPEADVYAFAMTCVEVLTGGRPPWPDADAEHITALVVAEKQRPRLPETPLAQGTLGELIEMCWDEDPAVRPGFFEVVQQLRTARRELH